MLPAAVGEGQRRRGDGMGLGVGVPKDRGEGAGAVGQPQPELDAERGLVGGRRGVIPFHQRGRVGDVGGVDPAFDAEAAAPAEIEFGAAGHDHARGQAIAEEGLVDFAGLPARQPGIIHRHIHRGWPRQTCP